MVSTLLYPVIRLPLPPEQSKFHQYNHRHLPITPTPLPFPLPHSFINLASNMNTFKPQEPTPQKNINYGNVTDSYDSTWNDCDFGVTDERRDILEWLSPLDPLLRHQDVRSSKMAGVGDWLLQTEAFIDWNTGEDGVVSPVLFCYGDPGVGKTYLRYEPTFS